MKGGTLLISRAVKNHAHYKKRLEALGFRNVTVTALEKDALYSLIREIKPELILMSARFYHCCTPFLMGELHKTFPKIKMAALCLGEYPADIAMYFILNGIKSYITSFDGIEQFYKGIDEVSKGREYVSPEVVKRIKIRRDDIDPAGKITERHLQIVRLICCGFKDSEIADVLAVSRNTVVNHKTSIFTSLNVRSPIELIRAALTLEIVRLEELYFYPKGYTVNPLPKKKIKGREKK
jgi:DNA-binding NarL/FixJ family response regulator